MLKVVEGFLIISLEESSALAYNEVASLMGTEYGDIANYEMDYRAGRIGIDGLYPMSSTISRTFLDRHDLVLAKVVTPVFDDCRLAEEPASHLVLRSMAPASSKIRVLQTVPNSLLTMLALPQIDGHFAVVAKPSLTFYKDQAVEGYVGLFVEACTQPYTRPEVSAPAPWMTPPPPPAAEPYCAAPPPVTPQATNPTPAPVEESTRELPSASDVIRGMFPLF